MLVRTLSPKSRSGTPEGSNLERSSDRAGHDDLLYLFDAVADRREDCDHHDASRQQDDHHQVQAEEEFAQPGVLEGGRWSTKLVVC